MTKSLLITTALYFSLFCSFAQTISSANNGEWFDANQWNQTYYPKSSNDVTLNHNITATLNATNTTLGKYSINSLTYGWEANKILTIQSDGSGPYTFDVQTNVLTDDNFEIVVMDDVVFSIAGNYTLSNSSSITLESGATANVAGNFAANSTQTITVKNGASMNITGELKLTNDMTVDVYGEINCNSLHVDGASPVINIHSGGSFDVASGVHLQNADLTVENNGSMTSEDVYVTGSPNNIDITGNWEVDGNFDVSQDGLTVEVNNPGNLIVTDTLFVGNNQITGDGNVDAGEIECGAGTGTDCYDQIDPLPIELISFTANQKNSKVEIKWSTASETNNSYFTLEKSLNGLDFNFLADILGAGNSYQVLHYSYIDSENSAPVVYYRLKQTDYDGKFSYSPIISAQTMGNIKVLQTDGHLFINVPSTNKAAKAIIWNSVGQRMVSVPIPDQKCFKLPISGLGSGVYILTIDELGVQEKFTVSY
jgi:hypothetical protein